MSVARRLIEIWTRIIHAPLMSPGSLLTVNSRRVDLDVWRAARAALIAAEVRTAHFFYACCESLCAHEVKACCVFFTADSRVVFMAVE